MSVVVCFYLWKEHLDIVCSQMVTYGLSIVYQFYHIRPQ